MIMAPATDPKKESISRRALLGSVIAGAGGGLSGCTDMIDRYFDDSEEQVEFTLTAQIGEEGDEGGLKTANGLIEKLETVGVDTERDLRTDAELVSKILYDQDFDAFLYPLPKLRYPEQLYFLFHSEYLTEAGWANPYGYTNSSVDTYLKQFVGLEDRFLLNEEPEDPEESLQRFLSVFYDEYPMIPLCRVPEQRLVRTDRYDKWDGDYMDRKWGYMSETSEMMDELEMSTTVSTPLTNLNPFTSRQDEWPITNLIYDSLMVETDEGIEPWLAETVTCSGDEISITLRDDAYFHAEEEEEKTPVTAEDVKFSYRLINDLTRGEGGTEFASPRHKWTSTLVDEISGEGRSVTIELSQDSDTLIDEDAWKRSLLPPIVPKYLWEEEFDDGSFIGIDAGASWEETLDDDVPLIGSGPYKVEDEGNDEVELSLHEDHFSIGSESNISVSPIAEEIVITLDANQATVIDLIEDGTVDVLIEPLMTEEMDNAEGVAEEDENIDILDSNYHRLYQLGLNARKEPMSDMNFRRVFAGLFDIDQLVEEEFDGKASAAYTPLPESPEDAMWWPDNIEYPDESSDKYPIVEYYGARGPDTFEEQARQAFMDIGYRYDDDGNLVVLG